MTCTAEIRRWYATRHEAWEYLASRGFTCKPSGWENGRWAARVSGDRGGFSVMIWLRVDAPVSQAA